MNAKPKTIAEYIRAAPKAGQPHLRKLHKLLSAAAPDAQQTIKWGAPFFVEPRFVFSFSGHKEHLDFAPQASVLAAFADELKQQRTTKHFLQVRYDEPLPEDLIRRMAEACVRAVAARETASFW